MDREKVTLIVELELDPIPGAFHTPESAQRIIQNALDQFVSAYKPQVQIQKD